MKYDNLRQFLIDANQAGYASGDEKEWVKQPDGSTTINFSKEDFRLDDNFFGGEPYGGRLVVFHKDKPFWMMVYYGLVLEGVDVNTVYSVLRNALKLMSEDAPYRGPREYKEGEFVYLNNWIGEIDNYSGQEEILHSKKVVYKANYLGGLVDQRRGV